MAELQGVIGYIVGFLPYSFLLPLVGAFVGGEETILVIAILSAAGSIPFWEVLVFSFIGTMLSDMCWFWFGGHFINYLERKPRISRQFAMVSAFVARVTRNRWFVALLITKFLYGTRIVMIFYLARKRLPFLVFAGYNSIVTGAWSLAVCAFGWYMGQSALGIIRAFGNITYGLLFIGILVITLYGIRIWLNRIIIEENHQ